MNIVFIMSDSFRYDHLGFTGSGKCETPNLDRFAESAHVFNKAYISSFPTIPNRWDIFTGRLNHTYARWQPLPADEVVLSQVMGEGSYKTMMIADTPHILQRGFDYQRGFEGFEWVRGQENDHWKTTPLNPELPCSPEKLRSPDYTMRHYMRNRSWWQSAEDCCVSRTMNTAVEWLESNHGEGEFFLYVDTFDPHEPWDAPAEYNAKYVDPGYKGEEITYPNYCPASCYQEDEVKFMAARYAAEADLVDTQVGKVIDAVERLGIGDETAIIFTSDHGFSLGDHGVMGKSIVSLGGEGYFESIPNYEEVAHIPLMIHLPGQNERKDHNALVQSIDMMPTILEMGEVIRTEVVKGIANIQTIQCGFHQEVEWSVDVAKLHGYSLCPMMNGEVEKVRDIAVSSATLTAETPRIAKATIIAEDWKLVYCGKVVDAANEMAAPQVPDNRNEGDYVIGEHKALLFNLKDDPGELKNVIEDNLDVARDLHARYIEFLKDKGTAPELFEKHREFTVTPG
jgi:arylsulfatase A-like enzyme